MGVKAAFKKRCLPSTSPTPPECQTRSLSLSLPPSLPFLSPSQEAVVEMSVSSNFYESIVFFSDLHVPRRSVHAKERFIRKKYSLSNQSGLVLKFPDHILILLFKVFAAGYSNKNMACWPERFTTFLVCIRLPVAASLVTFC